MPHILLEYSNNIGGLPDFEALFGEIHLALNQILSISPDNCKSRIINHDRVWIGDGNQDQSFIHLEIRILEGKPDILKKEAGEKVLSLLRDHFKPHITGKTQLTVELTEMSRQNYFKLKL